MPSLTGVLSGIQAFFGRRKASPTVTVGEAGIPIYGGYLASQEKDSRLQGRTRYVTYSDVLANIDIVTAGLRHFLDLIGGVTWKWEPADDSDEAKRLAEWTEQAVNDMETPWSRIMRRAAMYKPYGFSIAEWTAKRRPDGSIGFRDIETRPQSTIERWDVTTAGELLGCTQLSVGSGAEMYLARERLLYLVDDAVDNSPEGFGLLRGVVKHAALLQAYETLEAFGYDSDLRGMPLVRAPLAALRDALRQQDGTVDTTQIAALLTPLRDFLAKHRKSPQLGLMVDSATYRSGEGQPGSARQYDVEILRGDASGQQEIAAAIERKTRSIARILGCEFLLLGSDSQGSFAMHADKTTSFGLLVDSALTDLGHAAARDVVAPLWALNGFDDLLRPKPKPDKVQFRSAVEIVEMLERVARAGVPLDPEDEAVNAIRDLYGLPRAKIDRLLEREDLALQASARLAEGAPTGDPATQDEVDDEVEDDDEVGRNGNRRAAAPAAANNGKE